MNEKLIDGVLHRLIICRYIKKKGKIIYPKNGKVFAFWVKVK